MTTTTTDKKIVIFFVDDDQFLLDMYHVKFSNNNYDVHLAKNSEDALKILRDGFVPDILLLDVVMPGMNGIELLTNIRNEKLAKDSIVIMLTNQGLPDDIMKAKKLNVAGYIIKATTIPSEVLSEVNKIYANLKK